MPKSFAEEANIDPQAEAEVTEVASQNQEQSPDQDVALIVGERAFASMDDVKTKIVNQDSHISNIEAENAKLRAQLDEANKELVTAQSVEDVLGNREGNKDEGLTADQIEELVDKSLNGIKQKDLMESNRVSCIDKAKEAYGEKFIEKMQLQASELGLTMKDIDVMAGTNPKLFSKTFLPTKAHVDVQSSHTSTIRTSNFQDVPSGGDIKPVLSLSSKERTAQFVRQLEELKKQA